MHIALPKTTRFLHFLDYDPEQPALSGVGIQVWVDPPNAVIQDYHRINRQLADLLNLTAGTPAAPKTAPIWTRLLSLLDARRKLAHTAPLAAYHRALFAWYAALWSQGPEGTHWTADELAVIYEDNPAFWKWLTATSWVMINVHWDEAKKGYRPPEPNLPAPAEQASES